MDSRKFFIVGCARTGTTLVRRLFNAFEETSVYNWREESLSYLISSSTYNVIKRNSNSLMSNALTQEQIKKQVKAIIDNDIQLIYVERNKQDVLTSGNNYVSKERYDACIEQYRRHQGVVAFVIKYEDILADCDKVQGVVSKKLNLTIKHKWSDYPNFITEPERNLEGRYNLRPISNAI